MSLPVDVKIHPTVIFSIIDSYERRNEKMTRVVGTLLGTNIQGNIEVTDCFVVPHRDGDEVALDVEFARNSMSAYKKINPAVNIVGWFVSLLTFKKFIFSFFYLSWIYFFFLIFSLDRFSTGFDIPNTSCLIHEYYARETVSPIHLTIDTTLRNNKPEIKAYFRLVNQTLWIRFLSLELFWNLFIFVFQVPKLESQNENKAPYLFPSRSRSFRTILSD